MSLRIDPLPASPRQMEQFIRDELEVGRRAGTYLDGENRLQWGAWSHVNLSGGFTTPKPYVPSSAHQRAQANDDDLGDDFDLMEAV